MVRFQRADDAQLVGHGAQVGEQIADHRAAAAAGTKLPAWALEEPLELAKLPLPIVHRQCFAVVGDQFGLVVESVHV
jgi:hypothetical protein